MKFNKSPAY